MNRVTLEQIYRHKIAQKYLRRSGMAHAISVAQYAYELAIKYHVNPDWAAKAGFLHDIGHYTWYSNGQWDYKLYKDYDIHPIKGAERAHKLLIRLGESPLAAKEISHAILFHTESVLPSERFQRNSLQHVIYLADEQDKEPGNAHHYKKIKQDKELSLIKQLDNKINLTLSKFNHYAKSN
ncbi:HD domain-containing protein [Bacillaceae bacterium W0354]